MPEYIILPDHIKNIIENLHNKYELTRKNDCFYNPNNYIWYLGKNVLEDLQCCFDPYITFENKQRTVDILKEIRIELDYINPDGLRLFREVI